MMAEGKEKKNQLSLLFLSKANEKHLSFLRNLSWRNIVTFFQTLLANCFLNEHDIRGRGSDLNGEIAYVWQNK